MKTKIVYVVTFNEANYYLEQTLMSVYSARLHNPTAEIYLVTDPVSASTIKGKREEIKKYLTDILVFDTPDGYNNMKKSRYFKTNLRNLIDGDYIFIDSDTVICRPLDEVDNLPESIYGVANRHASFFNNPVNLAVKQFKTCGLDVKEDFIYINSGVMYVKDNEFTRSFYKCWYKNWLESGSKGIFMDQTSLHMTEVEMGYKINELGGKWNCQIEGSFLNYLNNAYIIHYYAIDREGVKSLYNLRDEKIYKEIQATGSLSKSLKNSLEHPYEEFSADDYRIINGQELEVYKNLARWGKLIHAFQSPKNFWFYLKKIKNHF